MNEATSLGGWFPEHLASQPHRGWGFADLEGSLPPCSRPAKTQRTERPLCCGVDMAPEAGGWQGGCHLLPRLLQVASPTSLFIPV